MRAVPSPAGSTRPPPVAGSSTSSTIPPMEGTEGGASRTRAQATEAGDHRGGPPRPPGGNGAEGWVVGKDFSARTIRWQPAPRGASGSSISMPCPSAASRTLAATGPGRPQPHSGDHRRAPRHPQLARRRARHGQFVKRVRNGDDLAAIGGRTGSRIRSRRKAERFDRPRQRPLRYAAEVARCSVAVGAQSWAASVAKCRTSSGGPVTGFHLFGGVCPGEDVRGLVIGAERDRPERPRPARLGRDLWFDASR